MGCILRTACESLLKMISRRTSLKVAIICFIAIASVISFRLVTAKFLEFVLDEPKLSGLRSAYAVLTTRHIQLSRSGKILGESNYYRENTLPVWTDRISDPSLLDCSLNVIFPPVVSTEDNGGYFMSERLLLVGPVAIKDTERNAIAVIYPGPAEDFNKFMNTSYVEDLFGLGANAIESNALKNSSGRLPQVERSDDTKLYDYFIAGRNVIAASQECEAYSFTVFKFDME